MDLRHCEESTAGPGSVFVSVGCVGAVGTLALLETLGIIYMEKKMIDMKPNHINRGFQHRHTSKMDFGSVLRRPDIEFRSVQYTLLDTLVSFPVCVPADVHLLVDARSRKNKKLRERKLKQAPVPQMVECAYNDSTWHSRSMACMSCLRGLHKLA